MQWGGARGENVPAPPLLDILQMKIDTYSPLCTLKRVESQTRHKDIEWPRKFAWNGYLCSQLASKGKFLKSVYFWLTTVVTQ